MVVGRRISSTHPGSGAASHNCHAATGATLSIMNRVRTDQLGTHDVPRDASQNDGATNRALDM